MTPLYHYELVLAAILYIIAFLLYTPSGWWRSWTGRALWTLLLTKTLFVSLVAGTFWFGDYGMRESFRFVVYTLVLLNSVVMVAAISAALYYGRKMHNARITRAGNAADGH